MSNYYLDMPMEFNYAVSIIRQYCQFEDCQEGNCSQCPYPLSVIRCGDKET